MQKAFCIAKPYFSDVDSLNGGNCEKVRFCEKQNVEKQSTKLHFSVILTSKHYKRLHFVQKTPKNVMSEKYRFKNERFGNDEKV